MNKKANFNDPYRQRISGDTNLAKKIDLPAIFSFDIIFKGQKF